MNAKENIVLASKSYSIESDKEINSDHCFLENMDSIDSRNDVIEIEDNQENFSNNRFKSNNKQIKTNKIRLANFKDNIGNSNRKRDEIQNFFESNEPYRSPSTSNSPSYSIILKAINRRKLKLSCPICSSNVLNMSDHLVKKHSIRDRLERKNIMDEVRRKFLMDKNSTDFLSNSNETSNNQLDNDIMKIEKDNLTEEKNYQITKDSNNKDHKKKTDSNKSSKTNIENSNSRKLIKCPLCNNDKHFVNISDHLIKVHQLATNDQRKPILRIIKQNPTNYIMSYENDNNDKIDFSTTNQISSKNSFAKIKLKKSKMSINNIVLNKRKCSSSSVLSQYKKFNSSNSNQFDLTSSIASPAMSLINAHLQQHLESNSYNENQNSLNYIDKIVAEDSIFNVDTPCNYQSTLLNLSSTGCDMNSINVSYTQQFNNDNTENNNESNNDNEMPENFDRLTTAKRNSIVLLLHQQRKFLLNCTQNTPIIETPSSSSLSSSVSSSLSDIHCQNKINIFNYNNSNIMNQPNEKDDFNNQNSFDSIRFDLSDDNNQNHRNSNNNNSSDSTGDYEYSSENVRIESINSSSNFNLNTNNVVIWSKLESMENKLNQTIDSFNILSENIIKQIRCFSNQLKSTSNEIKTLKNNYCQSMFLSNSNNNSSNNNSVNPLTPKSDITMGPPLHPPNQIVTSNSSNQVFLNSSDQKSASADMTNQIGDFNSNSLNTNNLIQYELMQPTSIKQNQVTIRQTMLKIKNEEVYSNDEQNIIANQEEDNDEENSSSSMSMHSFLTNINDLEKYRNRQMNQHQQETIMFKNYLENISSTRNADTIIDNLNKSNAYEQEQMRKNNNR